MVKKKSLHFKGQIDEMMVEEELFIDTVYWYRQPEDFEPAVTDG